MGEAKRRKELGIPPRDKKSKEIAKNDRYFSWLPLTKSQMSKYPYAPVATMALGLIFLLVDWTSFNSGSQDSKMNLKFYTIFHN